MGRPIPALTVAKPQHDGYLPVRNGAQACRSDFHHIQCRSAKSFVNDLSLGRPVVLSRADLFCDLLRLRALLRRFVRIRRTYLQPGAGSKPARLFRTFLLLVHHSNFAIISVARPPFDALLFLLLLDHHFPHFPVDRPPF